VEDVEKPKSIFLDSVAEFPNLTTEQPTSDWALSSIKEVSESFAFMSGSKLSDGKGMFLNNS